MSITYEWCVETIDVATDDVVSVDYYATLAELPDLNEFERVSLAATRQRGRFTDLLEARPTMHAVDGWVLPEEFKESSVRVPARFHKEWEANRDRFGKGAP